MEARHLPTWLLKFFFYVKEIESPMIAVSYYHVMKGWQLHIVYAGGVCGEDMPHISYVDYIDKRVN
jgi:hypothetical protein